jgi:hypothetical protein
VYSVFQIKMLETLKKNIFSAILKNDVLKRSQFSHIFSLLQLVYISLKHAKKKKNIYLAKCQEKEDRDTGERQNDRIRKNA